MNKKIKTAKLVMFYDRYDGLILQVVSYYNQDNYHIISFIKAKGTILAIQKRV